MFEQFEVSTFSELCTGTVDFICYWVFTERLLNPCKLVNKISSFENILVYLGVFPRNNNVSFVAYLRKCIVNNNLKFENLIKKYAIKTFLTRYSVNIGRRENDVHEHAVTKPVCRVRVTRQVNCNNVTIKKDQPWRQWQNKRSIAIEDCF